LVTIFLFFKVFFASTLLLPHPPPYRCSGVLAKEGKIVRCGSPLKKRTTTISYLEYVAIFAKYCNSFTWSDHTSAWCTNLYLVCDRFRWNCCNT